MNISNVAVNTGGSLDSVFNGAQAGIVEDVTVVLRDNPNKSPENRQPDFNLYYIDNQNREIKARAYWEEDPNATAEQKERLEEEMASLWSFNMPGITPPDNASIRDILDRICNSGKKRVLVTYGNTTRPSNYLESPKFKFMESATVPMEKSKLSISPSALLTRPPKPNTTESITDTSKSVSEPLF